MIRKFASKVTVFKQTADSTKRKGENHEILQTPIGGPAFHLIWRRIASAKNRRNAGRFQIL